MIEEKNKKGLGRGLMSLFGDQADEKVLPEVPNKDYLLVSIGDLERNQFQPRNYFDQKKTDELAQSIKKNGLIQPIAVRKGKKDGYEIIAGEELNSIEEAKGYDRLIKQFNYNHEKLSEFMGKSRSHIVNTLRLLNLPKEVIKLVDEGQLTAGQVRPLVGRHNAILLAHQILKEKLSSRSIENLVKNDNEKEKTKNTPKKNTDPNILLAQRRIEENIGLTTKIIYRKDSSGKVIIEYKNIDQFDMLSKMLVKKA